ncbi:MAG: AMP-binding protein, partial [Actinobacteria bacterium]|nr:AMP-binding protein [Actinomycetota bacterium]
MVLRRRRRTDSDALGAYAPGWDVPSSFNFTRDVVDAYAQDANRPALAFVDTEGIVDRLSFAEVSADAARWAHLLRTRLDRGDRVVLMLGKTPAWHCAMLGALKGGLVAVPCPDMLRAADLAYRVRHSGARLVVADRANEIEVEEMRNQVGGGVLVLYLDEAKRELTRYMPVAPTEDTRAAESALILYTSGTTKEPRGVVHTHAYTWAKRMQAAHWLDTRDGDVVWCTASTGWAKAVWNVLLGPWSHGAEIVLHEAAFEPEERLALMEKLGVTILCQAPTEYRFLAKSDALATAYVPTLRHAVSAGEPLNPEVIARFQETLGLTIRDGYGQTENTLLVANAPETEIRPGSMGLPTPGHDVAVIDEDGHVCPPDVEGDIALIGRPPTLFTGYWEAPEDTENAFRDGWYVTGDRAVRDAEGYLWFVGRADDVILSSAYRIGPFEVESALLEHPAVAESAVIGVPDEDRGQLVKAFVVLREGHAPDQALASELQEHVKAVTAPYKYPRAIAFVDELPKTTSGKIRRGELRANPDVGLVPVADVQPSPTEPLTIPYARD